MKYDVYYHNDFDGRASAAIMLAFLRGRGDDIARFFPMTYGYEREWLKEDLAKKGNPAIVVDFTYHPGAAWWFDHHATGFKKAAWAKAFRPDRQHRLDPRYESCAHFVYDSLRKEFAWKPPKHFAELVKRLDAIDGANFRSAKSTVEMREPFLLINAFIEARRHTRAEDRRIIRLLAERPLASVARAPEIAGPLRELKKKVKKSLDFQKKNLRMEGRLTFIDLTGDPLNGLLRYFPFFLHPKAVYGARLKHRGSFWYLGIGANPWRRKENRFDLGSVMRRYGGGGHKDVAAGEFSTKQEAESAFRKIAALLNG